ncbi:MAG: hypothetical protein GXO82_06220 [Chlorobi bacterium]|nr:hypothetical protein [Chlorobiota bacterium]
MNRTFFVFLFPALLLATPLVRAQEQAPSDPAQFLDWLRAARAGTYATQAEAPVDKCNFRLVADVLREWERSGPVYRQRIQAILRPPTLDTSIVSPSGFFEIHFDTTGFDSPAMLDNDGNRQPGTAFLYAVAAAAAFDYAYQQEIDSIGYERPPFQFGASRYHVFIKNMGGGLYGVTWPVNPYSYKYRRPTYTSYIEVDNDYKGYYSPGIEGLNVTAAHEFHHAIQLGGYGFWDTDTFFYELSSTFMEDRVYPDINDYYLYLKELFDDPEVPFFRRSGYDLALFGILMYRRYGDGALLKTWNNIRAMPPMFALDEALKERGGRMVQEYCTFSLWNYFTGYRADTSQSYREGAAYPTMKILQKTEIMNSRAMFFDELKPLATEYLQAYRGPDTVTFVVANVHSDYSLQKMNVPSQYTLDVMTEGYDDSYRQLTNGWGYKLTAGEGETFCYVAVLSGAVGGVCESGVYPNPYHPASSDFLTFRISDKAPPRVDLAVFTPAMEALYRQNLRVQKIGGCNTVAWNGYLSDGKRIPPGVYFYTVAYKGQTEYGKFAVVDR